LRRRRFFLLAALVAVGTATRWLFLESSPPGGSPLRPLFLGRVFPEAELERLGRLYRMQYPGESTIHGVMSRLLDGAEVDSLVPGNPVVARHLALQVAADFRADHTVILDGWVLSRTEARQCALLSLLA
jgi:hypothetical protein